MRLPQHVGAVQRNHIGSHVIDSGLLPSDAPTAPPCDPDANPAAITCGDYCCDPSTHLCLDGKCRPLALLNPLLALAPNLTELCLGTQFCYKHV
jgi:hypothetical protein